MTPPPQAVATTTAPEPSCDSTSERSAPTPPSPHRSAPRGRRRSRKPVRRFLIVTHRWVSLVAGALLVLIATTGAILVYEPEIMRWVNRDAYVVSEVSHAGHITAGQALAVVSREHGDFAPQSVTRDGGVWRVEDRNGGFTVDATAGRVVGRLADRPGWLGLTRNIHHCFLTCKDEPGYLSALEAPVPGTGWLSTKGKPVTVSGVVLGSTAVVFLFLVVSGLWLWFPRPSRWRSGFTVRWGKGRFARDLDLHKVIGFWALGPLLVWGISGVGFEFGAVKSIWYALTPGSETTVTAPVAAVGAHGDVGVDGAMRSAERLLPGATAMRVSLPRDAGEGYQVSLARGFDAMGHSPYPGDLRVVVDRATGAATQTRGNADHDLTQRIWEQWKYPLHAGTFVNPWLRAVWFVAGLTPLALMITGLSTWLFRRKSAAARAAARR